MIPEKLKFEILTPNQQIYSADNVSAVRLPGVEGYFGIYPGHTPFVAALKIGEIKVDVGGKSSYFTTTGGVAEVFPGSVRVLVEASENAEAIDVKRAEEAKKRAEKRIQEGRKNWDIDRAHISLMRALNRLSVASYK